MIDAIFNCLNKHVKCLKRVAGVGRSLSHKKSQKPVEKQVEIYKNYTKRAKVFAHPNISHHDSKMSVDRPIVQLQENTQQKYQNTKFILM